MPATAAHTPGSEEPALAPVVSITTRRGVVLTGTPDNDVTTETAETENKRKSREFWFSKFKEAGVDPGSEQAAAAIKVVTTQMDRLVSALHDMRMGTEAMEPDPEAGLDYTSMIEMTAMVRDLAYAVDYARKHRD